MNMAVVSWIPTLADGLVERLKKLGHNARVLSRVVIKGGDVKNNDVATFVVTCDCSSECRHHGYRQLGEAIEADVHCPIIVVRGGDHHCKRDTILIRGSIAYECDNAELQKAISDALTFRPHLKELEWGPDLIQIRPLTFAEATEFVKDWNESMTDGSKWRLPTFRELDSALYQDDWYEGCRPSPAYWASDGYTPGLIWTVQVRGYDKNEVPKDSDFKGILRLVKVQ